jgi:teichuronic acid biosynthesis glycosyltransferase TuaC
MKILYFSSVYPSPGSRCRGIYSLHLMKALSRRCEVGIVAPQSWMVGGNRTVEQGQPGESADDDWAKLVAYPAWLYPPGMLRGWHGAFMWWCSRPTVREMTRVWHPECVISYWAYPDGEAATRVARFLGVPAVIMVGGSDVLLLARQPSARLRIQRVLQRADAVVAVSRDLREKLLNLGIDEDKVQVVYRGVDEETYSPGDQVSSRKQLNLPMGRPILLWVGRMVPVKGLDILLQAIQILKSRQIRVLAILAGDGPLRKTLQSEVDARGLGEYVRFVGSVSHGELPTWYRAADLTVLPSRSEGVPNVLLESISCNTPFVASRVGGIPEIATEPIDRLVTPDSAQELADAIGKSLEAPGKATQRRFRPQSWAASADAILGVCQTKM